MLTADRPRASSSSAAAHAARQPPASRHRLSALAAHRTTLAPAGRVGAVPAPRRDGPRILAGPRGPDRYGSLGWLWADPRLLQDFQISGATPPRWGKSF